MGNKVTTHATNDNKTVRYAGPGLDADHTLAELVGNPRWRLVLVCDWGERTMIFCTRLASDRSVPGDEWHGHAQAFDVPIMGKVDAVALVAELTPLVGRVCDGYASEWSGSNHVGRFTADAREALEELEHAIHVFRPDRGPAAGELWAAVDWLEASPPEVTATATDSDLESLAKELQTTAHYEGVHLHGVDEYLEELRDEAREKGGS